MTDLNGNGSQMPIPISEDKELTLAFKRGEKGAYQEIYDRHSARVHGICRRMLNNPQDAEEAAQESLLKVYTALGRFNGRYQLGAWIARITTNVCLDHIRARSRRPQDIAPIEMVDADLRLSEQDGDPESLYIKRTEGRHVKKVLDKLPATHRAAIVLRDFEGLSYADIAIALEITEPQVKALLHRARCGFKRSWSTTGVAALFPWNLFTRFRRGETTFAEQANTANSASHVAQAAAPAIQPAAACATALQQCGQVLSERLGPAIVAGLVGLTSGVIIARNPQPEPEPKREIAIQGSASLSKPKVEAVKIRRNKTARVVESGADADPTTAPSPAPSTAPAPGPSEAPAEDPKPDEKPDPTTPQPKSVMTQFGFERGQEIPKVAATSNTASLDCAGQSFDQHVESLISDGAFSYRASLSVSVRNSLGSMQLRFWKDGKQYDYTSWGPSPSVQWSSDSLVITGEYGPMYGSSAPEESGLPQSGHFTANVGLDCASHTVVTESLVLTAE